MTGTPPRVSVVVPTNGRPELLQRCLEALSRQRLQDTCYEVIVADDGASETTRQHVEDWQSQFQQHGLTLRYVPVTGNHGPAAARNAGWRAARGQIIAFTDDDCLPEPDWLAAGIARLGDGADALSGRVVVPIPDTPTDYERDAANLASAEFVTANCFCRREALEAIGGFDERFTLAWREDSDLLASLRSQRFVVQKTPAATVIHPVRPARWGVSVQQQHKSMFNALLYKKHPQHYRRLTGSGTPWHYYQIVAALLIASGAQITGRRRLALLATLFWTLLTGRFCAARLRDTSHTPRHVTEMVVTSSLIPPLSIFWRLYGAAKFRVRFF